MKVFKFCKNCGKSQITGYKCEVCGEISPFEQITISFGYGHPSDGNEIHICSDKCICEYFKK